MYQGELLDWDQLFDVSEEFLALIGTDGYFKKVSSSIRDALGYTEEELFAKPFLEFIDAEEASKPVEYPNYFSAGSWVDLYRCKDGSTKWLWWKGTKINDCLIYASARDITGQKIAEKQHEVLLEQKIEKENAKAAKRLEIVLNNLLEGFFSLSKDWNITAINSAAASLLNLSPGQLLNASYLELFPEAKELIFYREFCQAFRENSLVQFEEYYPPLKKWYEVAAYPYEGALTVFFKDITELKTKQQTFKLVTEALEMNASLKHPVKDILDLFLLRVQDIYPDMKCSVMRKKGDSLFPLSAPSMPSTYIDALVKCGKIDPDGCACGTSAFFKTPIIADDISANKRDWSTFKNLTAAHNFKACWSFPVLDGRGETLGTLACYFETCKSAEKAEVKFIEHIRSIVQLLLESDKIKEKLLVSNERYRLVTLATNDAIWDWDLTTDSLYWADGFEKLFGYKRQKINVDATWSNKIHADDAPRVLKSLYSAIDDPIVNEWREEYRFLKADQSYAYIIDNGYIIRNAENQAIRMVGSMLDITRIKEHEQQIIDQNQLLQEIAEINSHLIRKPIANILAIIGMFKEAGTEYREELITLLEESGNRLDSIIREIAKKSQ